MSDVYYVWKRTNDKTGTVYSNVTCYIPRNGPDHTFEVVAKFDFWNPEEVNRICSEINAAPNSERK